MSKTKKAAAEAAGAEYRIVPRWRIRIPVKAGAVDPLLDGIHDRLKLSFEGGVCDTENENKARQARNMGYEVSALKPLAVLADPSAAAAAAEEEEFDFDAPPKAELPEGARLAQAKPARPRPAPAVNYAEPPA